jgi:hypothetical protein
MFSGKAGLFIIKSIAKVNRNFFVIYSGTSMYKLLKGSKNRKIVRLYPDPFEDKHSLEIKCPKWQGTVVGIDIRLDSAQRLSVLLDNISSTYLRAIKNRKKEKYRKRARFE